MQLITPSVSITLVEAKGRAKADSIRKVKMLPSSTPVSAQILCIEMARLGLANKLSPGVILRRWVLTPWTHDALP